VQDYPILGLTVVRSGVAISLDDVVNVLVNDTMALSAIANVSIVIPCMIRGTLATCEVTVSRQDRRRIAEFEPAVQREKVVLVNWQTTANWCYGTILTVAH
jgi:hypothetical protein